MKKIVSMMMLAILLMTCAVGYAEGIDVSAMSTDDLLAIREMVNAEITIRIGGDDNLIGDGVYVAGVDIKPGRYKITCAAAFDDREFYVNLFDSKEHYQEYDKSRWNNASYRFSQAALIEGGVTFVNLADGMTIEIYNGIGRMEAVQPDWAL